jgi:hypothetical protein
MKDNQLQKAQGPVPLPTLEMVTGHQLANLINAGGFLLRSIEGQAESMFSEGSVSALDGGAKMAAEAAFVKVCQGIENILDDKWRWKTTERDALLVASLDMVKQNTEFLRTQTAAAAMVLRPSFRFHPSLAKLAGGMGWAVILGNPDEPDTAIIGIGETPEDAYAAFDNVFAGTANEKMKQWALAREKEIEDNAEKDMVNGRIENPAPTGQRGEDTGTDRPAGRKKRGGRGSQTPPAEGGPNAS